MENITNSVFEDVLDSIKDGIISINKEGIILYINEQATLVLNKKESLVGRNIWRELPEVIIPLFKMKMEELFPLENKIHFVTAFPDDRGIWLEVHMYAANEGVTILFRDVSTIKNVEKTIANKHETHILLYEAANHLLFKHEPKEILDSLFLELSNFLDVDVYFNYLLDESGGKLKLTNFGGINATTEKELEWLEIGEAVSGFVAQRRAKLILENIDHSLDPMVTFIKKLGVRAYACHPLMSYGKLIGTLSFGSFKRSRFSNEEIELIHKICDQVAATLERTLLIKELKQKKEEAEQASKAKSEFLSMLSHEFRTPLNSILGFGQILEDDQNEPLSKSQTEKINKMMQSGRHLLKLINQMLDLMRMESTDSKVFLEPINLYDLLRKCMTVIQPDAKAKEINIYYHSEGLRKKYVWGVSTYLEQVITNLLSNAVKYNKVRGSIQVTWRETNDRITICIQDTGIGIDSSHYKKILTPFYRIFHEENNIEGMGIGLALVKKLVESMDGKVGVTSEPGKGSNFSIQLRLLKNNHKEGMLNGNN